MLSDNTFSPQAEINIIEGILDCPFLRKTKVRKRLALLPNADREQRIRNICEIFDYLMDPREELKFFEFFKQLDYYLTASGKRAHFVHTFEVYLIGLRLIREIIQDRSWRTQIFGTSSLRFVFNCWLITCASHDLGRPLEEASKIALKLSELYEKYNFDKTSEAFKAVSAADLVGKELALTKYKLDAEGPEIDIEEILGSCLGNTLGIDRAQGIEIARRMREAGNHGYISGAILLRNWTGRIKKISRVGRIRNRKREEVANKPYITSLMNIEEKCPNYWKMIVLSLGGVLAHSIDKLGDPDLVSKIKLETNPYAFILFLVDNLQDWDRPAISDENWPFYYLADFNVHDKAMYLKYVARHETWDDDVKTRCLTALHNKKLLLTALTNITNVLGYQVGIQFTSDRDLFDDTFEISF